MKVVFDYHLPFLLAHGGLQTQIGQTMTGVQRAGAEVEPLRWWDETQRADVIHYFGRVPVDFLAAARVKGIRVVQAELLTEQGARSWLRLRCEGLCRMGLRRFRGLRGAFRWDSYQMADAYLANTEWEARLMRDIYGAPAQRVHVVPNGVEEVFLNSRPAPRGPWLVCSATITQRKRVLELAAAAVQARTPLWVIGKPYGPTEGYARRFLEYTAAHPDLLKYEGQLRERSALAAAYRQARGFVLLSTMETRSLAAEEASACECPLMLSDLPWARSVFGDAASYVPRSASQNRTAKLLRRFYEAAPHIKPAPKPVSWSEVGRRLLEIYEGALRTSL